MKVELPSHTCCNLRGFGVLRKGIENERQKTSQNDIKIGFWALRGRIFEFLGGVLRDLIFDEFLVCKKTTENQKKTRRRRERAILRQGSAGRGGSSRGFLSQQESARVSKIHQRDLSARSRSLPCPPLSQSWHKQVP